MVIQTFNSELTNFVPRKGISADCPHGWFHFQRKCFKVMTEVDTNLNTRHDHDRPSYRWRDRYDEEDDDRLKTKKVFKKYSFSEALLACQSFDGGSMVTIHTQDEQNFLTHLLFESLNIGDTWIGLTQVSKNKRGRRLGWIDGSSFNFTDWFPGEPRYLNSDKLCVTLFSQMEFQGRWFEHECGDRKHLVCQTTHGHDDDKVVTKEMHLDMSPLLLSLCIVLALALGFTCYLGEFPKAQQLLKDRSSGWLARSQVTRENSVESGPKFHNRF